MDKTAIIDLIKKSLVETLKLPVATPIPTDIVLRDDFGLDSMSSLSFLIKLENHIPGFIVNPETLEENDLDTIETVYAYIQKSIGS